MDTHARLNAIDGLPWRATHDQLPQGISTIYICYFPPISVLAADPCFWLGAIALQFGVGAQRESSSRTTSFLRNKGNHCL